MRIKPKNLASTIAAIGIAVLRGVRPNVDHAPTQSAIRNQAIGARWFALTLSAHVLPGAGPMVTPCTKLDLVKLCLRSVLPLAMLSAQRTMRRTMGRGGGAETSQPSVDSGV